MLLLEKGSLGRFASSPRKHFPGWKTKKSDAGADVNLPSHGEYGNALQATLLLDSRSIMYFLLDEDAKVNASGGRYGTPLQAATGNRT
jgi:hypothetical protein